MPNTRYSVAELEIDDDGEFDFSEAERGKYVESYMNVGLFVSIDKDLATVFDSADKVNRALRLLVELGELTQLLSVSRPTAPVVAKASLVLAEENARYETPSPTDGTELGGE